MGTCQGGLTARGEFSLRWAEGLSSFYEIRCSPGTVHMRRGLHVLNAMYSLVAATSCDQPGLDTGAAQVGLRGLI